MNYGMSRDRRDSVQDLEVGERTSILTPFKGGGSVITIRTLFALVAVMFIFVLAILGVTVHSSYVAPVAVNQLAVSSLYPLPQLPLKEGLVFVGHQRCDTDSIVSAIMAAALFKGDAASCNDELNGETKYLLDRWGFDTPLPANDSSFADREWGLVDFNLESQKPVGVDEHKVYMIIDHHNLGDIMGAPQPIEADFRIYGCAATIVAYRFFESHTPIPSKKHAGLLLSAIISDTLALQSSITTDHDRVAIDYLANFVGLTQADLDTLSREMFVAKSDVSHLTDEEIVMLDYKEYEYTMAGGSIIKVGWGAAETALSEDYRARKESFITAMRKIKADRGMDLVFFGPVNLVDITIADLYLCDDREARVAEDTYGRSLREPGIVDMGGFISRKSDFLPPLQEYLESVNSIDDLLGKRGEATF